MYNVLWLKCSWLLGFLWMLQVQKKTRVLGGLAITDMNKLWKAETDLLHASYTNQHATAEECHWRQPGEPQPSHPTCDLSTSIKDTGSVQGRPLSGRPLVFTAVSTSLKSICYSQRSTKKITQQCDTNRSSVHLILQLHKHQLYRYTSRKSSTAMLLTDVWYSISGCSTRETEQHFIFSPAMKHAFILAVPWTGTTPCTDKMR